MYKIQNSYPVIEKNNANIMDARRLMEVYAGHDSETTLMMCFRYGAFVTKDDKLADLLMNIANDDMLHQELLAKCILVSGGTPVFGDNHRFWNGGFVNFTTTPQILLKNNLKTKQNFIAMYEQLIPHINNPSIVATIERILIDEENHCEKLMDAISNMENTANKT